VPRRFTDVDALRTGLVAGVVVFHGLRVFDPFDFYVKGPELEALVPVVLLGVLVGMPLFFVLAGFGLWHSLGRRSAATVVRERALRLGVPFVVGVVVLVPPQIHAERLQDGTAGSYWDTLRDFFSVLPVVELPIPVEGRGDGPFEPAHLWFLAYLLVFSVLLVRCWGRCAAIRPAPRRRCAGWPAAPDWRRRCWWSRSWRRCTRARTPAAGAAGRTWCSSSSAARSRSTRRCGRRWRACAGSPPCWRCRRSSCSPSRARS